MTVSNGLSHGQGEPDTIKDSKIGSGTGTVAPAGKVNKANSIMVNPRQRGNPILKHIRSVPWEFGDIIPDYEMSRTSCAVFLSVRYHQLNPDYIHTRLKQLGKGYDLRVLLLQVDVKDPHYAIKELAKICLLADNTLMLAFSPEEAGRYLETYKVYENKPPDALMEKTENNYMAKLTDCLTTIKSVNKTDCMTLFNTFGCVEKMMEVGVDDLSFCPGIGPQKAKRIYDVFHEPFIKARKKHPEPEAGPSMSTTDEASMSRSAEKS